MTHGQTTHILMMIQCRRSDGDTKQTVRAEFNHKGWRRPPCLVLYGSFPVGLSIGLQKEVSPGSVSGRTYLN